MKRLVSGAVLGALLFAPALALAQTAVNVSSSVEASYATSSPRIPLKKLGPAIKETIENWRENTANTASTTRETVKERGNAVQTLIDARKADIRARIERKLPLASSTVALREQKRAELRARIIEKKEMVEDRIEAARAQAKEKFGQNVQRSVNAITDRLAAALSSLATIADRIDARIKQYEAASSDMSVSIELLAAARADIASAQDKVAAAGASLTAALAAEDPKQQIKSVRGAIQEAEAAFRAAKESLYKALESVRAESAISTTTN